MKCSPASTVALASGNIIHDCHAEVLAIRAFNHFLIQECGRLASSSVYRSPVLQRRGDGGMTRPCLQPFAIKQDIRICLYCSEAPCGDASMELTMRAQQDATSWPAAEAGCLQGRGCFSQLGIVRRKPCERASYLPFHPGVD